MIELCMTNFIKYDTPDGCPEWDLVEACASYAHCANGEAGVWDFIIYPYVLGEVLADKHNVDIIAQCNGHFIAALVNASTTGDYVRIHQ